MTYEIYRFYKLCKTVKRDNLTNSLTISEFLDENNFFLYEKFAHLSFDFINMVHKSI